MCVKHRSHPNFTIEGETHANEALMTDDDIMSDNQQHEKRIHSISRNYICLAVLKYFMSRIQMHFMNYWIIDNILIKYEKPCIQFKWQS